LRGMPGDARSARKFQGLLPKSEREPVGKLQRLAQAAACVVC
jgi:hypothetical protein